MTENYDSGNKLRSEPVLYLWGDLRNTKIWVAETPGSATLTHTFSHMKKFSENLTKIVSKCRIFRES